MSEYNYGQQVNYQQVVVGKNNNVPVVEPHMVEIIQPGIVQQPYNTQELPFQHQHQQGVYQPQQQLFQGNLPQQVSQVSNPRGSIQNSSVGNRTDSHNVQQITNITNVGSTLVPVVKQYVQSTEPSKPLSDKYSKIAMLVVVIGIVLLFIPYAGILGIVLLIVGGIIGCVSPSSQGEQAVSLSIICIIIGLPVVGTIIGLLSWVVF